ncbi:hypothetical protein HNR02_002556 [Amycolatopsis endophytica]|uniref:Uncharacterized protein n=1 Tax=Amycolatopsis endophytica TaxID=860233 RepID=A0A853B278_9PSEU|nr:hypothetical protein [Amycolatopsis endophytica]NYI89233.1 hypothetical protein [Amycolatopsis endophytica]
MKTSTVIAIVIGVLLSFASVAGAAGYIWSQGSAAPPAAPGLPAVWPTKDGELPRRVPMPSGEMIAALPSDSSGHVLCQALSEQRWQAVLGGATLREVRGGGCHIVTGSLDVVLRLDNLPAQLRSPQTLTVSGRAAEVESSGTVNARLNAHLVDDQPSGEIHPYLRVEITRYAVTRPGLALDELATSIARDVIDSTMAPGPDLPRANQNGVIAMEATEPVPGYGILDSPWPVVSWQLCTSLAEAMKTSTTSAKPKFDGRCTVRTVQAALSDDVTPRAYPDTLAGRPALITPDVVAVKLDDDTSQELSFTGTGRDLRALAESVLPALLGR